MRLASLSCGVMLIVSLRVASLTASEPPSVFEPLDRHPYIPANASYAPAPAAYVSVCPHGSSSAWSLAVPPSAYGAPSYVAFSPTAVPGWRIPDSPTYFRPGFGYVLPMPVFHSQSFGYLDNYSFGQKNSVMLLESIEPWRATATSGPRYYPGASTNESRFRFNW